MLDLGVAFATAGLLGVRHAIDADHVVAVSTIASRERSVWGAGRVGAIWGLGHTFTILAVGGAIVAFRLALTPRVGLSLELAVAVMLVVLGTLNLLDRPAGAHGEAVARPFAVGAVHGLAGSAAATLMVVPLIADPRAAAAYLVVFGLGTIAGMAAVAAAIAAPGALVTARLAGARRAIRLASGALCLAFGVYLAVRVGFVDGLFIGR